MRRSTRRQCPLGCRLAMADPMRYRFLVITAACSFLVCIACLRAFYENDTRPISPSETTGKDLPSEAPPSAAPATDVAMPTNGNPGQNGADDIIPDDTLASRLRATPSDDVLGIVAAAKSKRSPTDLRLLGTLSTFGGGVRTKANELTDFHHSGATPEQVRTRINELFPGIRDAEAKMHAIAWWRTSYGIPDADLPIGLGRPPVDPTAIRHVRAGGMPHPNSIPSPGPRSTTPE